MSAEQSRGRIQETVYVIPPYPHNWWEREEIEEGVLVQLGWPEGDDTIYRVTGVWDGGASLVEEKRRA